MIHQKSHTKPDAQWIFTITHWYCKAVCWLIDRLCVLFIVCLFCKKAKKMPLYLAQVTQLECKRWFPDDMDAWLIYIYICCGHRWLSVVFDAGGIYGCSICRVRWIWGAMCMDDGWLVGCIVDVEMFWL